MAIWARVLLLALAITGGHAAPAAELCASKSKPRPVSIDEVRSLIGELEVGSAVGCSDEQRNAILDLKPLFEEQEVEVCSLEFVKKFQGLHEKYIGSKAPHRSHLPKPIERSFVELGFKLNHHCKINLINKFPRDLKLVQKADMEIADTLMDYYGRLEFVFKNATSYNNLVLLTDMLGPHSPLMSKERFVKVSHISSGILELHSRCKKVFRPIYERRILPVTKLASLGYGSDESFLQPIGELKELLHWYKLTIYCNILLTHEIIFEPPSKYRHDSQRLISSDEEPLDIRSCDVDPDRKTIVLEKGDELRISDDLFAHDEMQANLQNALGKFSPQNSTGKRAQKMFVNQISLEARRIILKRVKLSDLFSNGSKGKSIKMDLLIRDLIADQEERPPVELKRIVEKIAKRSLRFLSGKYFLMFLLGLISMPKLLFAAIASLFFKQEEPSTFELRI